MPPQNPKRSPAAAPRPAGKKGLDRQQVLEAARELCGSAGVQQLSVKELAQRLGIQPPSVYAHFQGGLADLRRALALWGHRALAEHLQGAAAGLAGSAALLALAHAYRDFIRREPGLYSATVATPREDDAELREASEVWVGVLFDAAQSLGLSHEDAVHALRGIRSIVHGFGLLETSGAFLGPVDRDSSFTQVLKTFVTAVAEQGIAKRGRAAGASAGPRTAAPLATGRRRAARP
ncbi:MAG TPA: TetR/AcrR family transcriptional regulator [Ramlibacter sp.]|nr:TetR/AcrR family transcriptional regulator [Ramlibacter sp.]